LSKIKKNEKTKSLSTKTTAPISKSTNDLTISHIPVSNKALATSSIPIVLTSSLDKSKSKSVSSLKKSEKSDTETRSLKDLTKTQRNLKKKESVKKASSTSSERKSFSKIEKIAKISVNETKLKQNEVELNKKPINKTQTNIEKTFKRTIVNKKLPVRLNLKNKQSSEKTTTSKTEITLGINKKQTDVDANNKSEKKALNQLCTSQKREIVLYKDDNLGFGFIAGSEKPLVVRFVTPG
jgi:hypothetical protein